jgi:hypothetical protein
MYCPTHKVCRHTQERLSHYLDIVEIHLLQEIGTRSDSFFQALAVLNDLGGLMHKVRRAPTQFQSSRSVCILRSVVTEQLWGSFARGRCATRSRG